MYSCYALQGLQSDMNDELNFTHSAFLPVAAPVGRWVSGWGVGVDVGVGVGVGVGAAVGNVSSSACD